MTVQGWGQRAPGLRLAQRRARKRVEDKKSRNPGVAVPHQVTEIELT